MKKNLHGSIGRKSHYRYLAVNNMRNSVCTKQVGCYVTNCMHQVDFGLESYPYIMLVPMEDVRYFIFYKPLFQYCGLCIKVLHSDTVERFVPELQLKSSAFPRDNKVTGGGRHTRDMPQKAQLNFFERENKGNGPRNNLFILYKRYTATLHNYLSTSHWRALGGTTVSGAALWRTHHNFEPLHRTDMKRLLTLYFDYCVEVLAGNKTMITPRDTGRNSKVQPFAPFIIGL